MKKIILLAVLFCAAFSVSAQELTFVSLKKNGVTKINNCNLFGEQTFVKVIRGKVLKFTVKGSKKYFKLPNTYKLGACGKINLEALNDSFFGKADAEAEAEQSDVTSDSLVSTKGIVGRQCRRIITSFPSALIYKTPGVKYGGAVSVIFHDGVEGIPFPQCIQIVDVLGKVVAKLGYYHPAGEYAARYYAGHGCGSDTPLDGDEIANIVDQTTGTQDVLIDFGTVCVGPIEADECINSRAC